MKNIQNGRDIHLHMSKKQNGYQNVNNTFYFIWGFRLLNLGFVYDLGAETHISDVYF